ncbi:MAG: hypothetical protein M0P27_10060 [Bacteroidales bacterium]|nr:hypothetical protein [Bacteroidales bacterium]
MRRKSIIWIISLTSVFVSGYFCAVVTFKKLVYIDYETGTLKIIYKIFPFENSSIDNGRAFNVCYEPPKEREPDWRIVGQEGLIPLINYSATTEGYQLLQAENMLVQLISVKDFTIKEREEISREFFNRMKRGGVIAANEYAKEVWDKVTLEWRSKTLSDKPCREVKKAPANET